MKTDKIYVEKPADDNPDKKDEKKKQPDKKEPITISKKNDTEEIGNNSDTDWNKESKKSKGPGSEITDGEDG